MGVSHWLKSILSAGTDGDELLEPLLASQGIQAARCDIVPEPEPHVLLSVKIRGRIAHIPIPTAVTLTTAQICALIAGKPPAETSPDQAKPPPENSSP